MKKLLYPHFRIFVLISLNNFKFKNVKPFGEIHKINKYQHQQKDLPNHSPEGRSVSYHENHSRRHLHRVQLQILFKLTLGAKPEILRI